MVVRRGSTVILSRQLVLAWQFSFISHFGEVVKYSERNAEGVVFDQEPVHNVWRQIAHLQSGRKWNFLNAGLCLPWVPETFHAWYPVSVMTSLKKWPARKASPLVSSAKGRRRVGLRPTKLLVTCEKKSLVARVDSALTTKMTTSGSFRSHWTNPQNDFRRHFRERSGRMICSTFLLYCSSTL